MPPEQLAAVERRMRDSRFSRARFLGRSESLLGRVRADSAVLRELGITHRRIARRLEAIVRLARRIYRQRADTLEHQARLKALFRLMEEKDPRAREMWNEASTVIVARRFRVAMETYCGFQYCPFGYREELSYELLPGVGKYPVGGVIESCGQASVDISIENLGSGASIHFSELMVHLIRDHEFFEGQGLKYRLDPRQAVKTLGLK